MSAEKWMHIGDGRIATDRRQVGRFIGDFRDRDRLILAVNGEKEAADRIVELERQLADANAREARDYNELLNELEARPKFDVEAFLTVLNRSDWRTAKNRAELRAMLTE